MNPKPLYEKGTLFKFGVEPPKESRIFTFHKKKWNNSTRHNLKVYRTPAGLPQMVISGRWLTEIANFQIGDEYLLEIIKEGEIKLTKVLENG